jgi:beta-lactamase class A
VITFLFSALCLAAPHASAATVDASSAAAAMFSNGSVPHSNRGIFAPARGLIHPLIDINVARSRKDPWLAALEAKTIRLISQLKKEGLATDISMEFVDIERTAQFDVDDTIRYKPASMVKLPMMIAYLKQHEDDPELLNRRLTLLQMPPQPFTPEYPPKRRLPLGKDYSINELLEAMVSRSDNDAAYTLFNYMHPGALSHLYEDLGVLGPEANNPNQLVTVHDLSAFLRILYVGGYLSWDHSQQALEYLAASDFSEGLRALLPPGTTIAHKYGEAGDSESNLTQIHDCGFVYHPKGPYMLCVLTRGKEQHKQATAIARISKLVYDEVDNLSIKTDMSDAQPAR